MIRPRAGTGVPIGMLLMIGVAAGSLSGLLGVGGGVVMVPALLAVGHERHRAHAISLSTITLIALAGAASFATAAAVDLPLGLAIGVGGVVGAATGARLAGRMSQRHLALVFGVLLLVTGLRMLWAVDLAPGSTELGSVPALTIGVLLGLASGVISGLAGVGGGVIMVPAMVLLLGLDQHTAEGTSLLAIILTAGAATGVHQGGGLLDWRASLWIALSGVVSAPAAATLALRMEAATLARVFAVWLLVIGVRTLISRR